MNQPTMDQTIAITPIDPLVARDSRPFGLGGRMRSLPWLLPSVVAGSLRTALVKSTASLDFSHTTLTQLRGVEVAGVFPTDGKSLYVPAPKDCLRDEETKKVHAVGPVAMGPGEGCDMPAAGLQPVRLTTKQSEEDFKPEPVPAWWPMQKMVDWLLGRTEAFEFDKEFLLPPAEVVRDHVELDADRGAAEEGKLFSTVSLAMTHLARHGVDKNETLGNRFQDMTLTARVRANGSLMVPDSWGTLHPLGGERRLAHWQAAQHGDLWKCPPAIQEALASATRLRMVLATPAIFRHGWRPAWINEATLEGTPPGMNVALKLVGVCIDRWRGVSGWSMAPINDKGELDPQNGRRGPKPMRRMVPAGGVYFFEKLGGDGRSLAENGWLRSVSDEEQERQDGFGLALWGTW